MMRPHEEVETLMQAARRVERHGSWDLLFVLSRERSAKAPPRW